MLLTWQVMQRYFQAICVRKGNCSI